MIQVCPNCGFSLNKFLNDGLTHCSHCNQVFDSSDYSKLLSAAWEMRKEHYSLEQLQFYLKLDEDEAILVHSFVEEYGYNHQEFMKLLKKLGVANKSYINFSA